MTWVHKNIIKSAMCSRLSKSISHCYECSFSHLNCNKQCFSVGVVCFEILIKWLFLSYSNTGWNDADVAALKQIRVVDLHTMANYNSVVLNPQAAHLTAASHEKQQEGGCSTVIRWEGFNQCNTGQLACSLQFIKEHCNVISSINPPAICWYIFPRLNQ